MKILKYITGFISILTGLVILIYFTHDYPANNYELAERTTYLRYFSKANDKGEVEKRMDMEIKEGSSVINDLLITEWAIENRNCKWLDDIQNKIVNYQYKKSLKKDNYIGDELYLLESLIKKYDELKNRCLQEN